MTKGKTTLIQKDTLKGTTPKNYRPITSRPMMWKMLSAKIREEIYYLLISHRLFPEEQNGCLKGTRDTGERLYIDQHIPYVSKTRREKLAMAGLTTKRAYDAVPKSWILHCIKMFKIPDDVIQFIKKNLETWTVELTARWKSLAEVKIPGSIFQGDALSLLLFVIAMMPLNHVIRKCTAGYKLSRSQEKINHLMYKDDINFFAKNERELETLIQTVRIYSQDKGIEFGIEKCAILVTISEKQHMTKRIEIPNHEKI